MSYYREKDPLFRLAVPLINGEQNTTTKKILEVPSLIAASLNNKTDRKVKKSQESQATNNKVQTEASSETADQNLKTSLSCSDVPKSGCSSCQTSETMYTASDNSEAKYSAIRTLLNTPSFPEHLLNKDGSNISDNYPYPHKLFDGSLVLPPYFLNRINPDAGLSNSFNQNLVNCCFMNGFINPSTNQPSDQTFVPPISFLDPSNRGFDFQGLPSHLSGGHFKPASMLRTQTFSNPCNIKIPQTPPTGVIDHVLQDHCYLNRIQMQKLSPRRDKDSEARSKRPSHSESNHGEVDLSSHKKCLSFDQCDKSDCETALNLCIRDINKTGTSNSSKCSGLRTCSESPRISDNVKYNPTESLGQHKAEVKCEARTQDCEVKKCESAQKMDSSLTKEEELKEQGRSDSEEIEGQKKRKLLSRSTSVPGWFGKGLNKRKKRRL